MKQLQKIVASLLKPFAVLAITSQVYAQSATEICYELVKPNRFGNLPLQNISYFGEFTANPLTPGAPPLDTSGITFNISYTGVAPTQSLAGEMCITWDPSVTTVSIPGITGAPPSIVGADKSVYELCHTCYDFVLDTSRFTGTVTVIDSTTKEVIKADGEGIYQDILGGATIATIGESKGTLTACFSDLKVCYCPTPEPSSALMGLSGIALLALRRRK